MKDQILLGFEIGSGEPVYISPSHIIVTGITSKSGKTTTLQALAARSEGRILVFKTKPGEEVFQTEHVFLPFFKEKADWEYVAELLEATMREKMKFERYWIITAAKGARTLEDVDRNCVILAAKAKEGSIHQSIYTNLHAYFEKVLPELEGYELASEFPTLQKGVNVMDLTQMSDEVQSLIIRSCLDYILARERDVTVILPEIWKFAPEGRGNPVKHTLDRLIRQGATKRNFCWIDSQDLAGVDKSPLKQVFTWVLGLQTERNEVKHTLDQIPRSPKDKPKAEEVMSLELGHFILATPKTVKRVYVQPVWLSEEDAWNVARASRGTGPRPKYERIDEALPMQGRPQADIQKLLRELTEAKEARARAETEKEQAINDLQKRVLQDEELGERMDAVEERANKAERVLKSYENLVNAISEIVDNVVSARLNNAASTIGIPAAAGELSTTLTQIQLTKKVKELQLDDTTVRGRILVVVVQNPKQLKLGEFVAAFEKKGWGSDAKAISSELTKMNGDGLLGRSQLANRQFVYFLPEGVKVVEK